MDAALCARFHPEEYHRQFLADGLRSDGRAPHERRSAKVLAAALSSTRGSSSARLGASAAVAGVRAEVTEAQPDLLASGHIVATVELPALGSSAFRERQRTGGITTFLSNALTEILNSSQVFDPKQLQIKEGELYWVLHVHIVCVNYDGNAFDLSLLSALAALEDTRLPALGEGPMAGGLSRLVEVAGDHAQRVADARRLKLLSRPLPASFTLLAGQHWVLDPCTSEEGLGASVSLCLVGGKWLVYHQGGGASADQVLGELMPAARASVGELSKVLDAAASTSAAAKPA